MGRKIWAVATAMVVVAAGAVAVNAGVASAAASAATLYGRGLNIFGETGTGTAGQPVNTPRAVPFFLPGTVTQVAAGSGFSAALRSDGTVWAWGRNDSGQLGRGRHDDNDDSVPAAVAGLSHVVQIATGATTGAAVTADGTAWTWGLTADVEQDSPTPVAGLTGVVQVAAGEDFAVALKSDGSVWAWGADDFGQLGTGTPGPVQHAPVRVAVPGGVIALSVQGWHAIAMRSPTFGGAVWQWGELAGQGPEQNVNPPALVMNHAISVTATLDQGFAAGVDHVVYTWGGNFCGSRGTGTVRQFVPTAIKTGITGVVALASDSETTIAIGVDGTLRQWGRHADDAPIDQCMTPGSFDTTPVALPGLTGVRQVAMLDFNTLILADTPAPTPTPTPTPSPTPTTGPTLVSVPDVVSLTCARAVTELQAVGLTGTCHGTGTFVSNQSPGAGARVAAGTNVSLTTTASAP